MNKYILLEKIEENYTKHKTKILYISLIIILFIILQIFLLYCLKLNENEIKNIYKDIFWTIWIIFLAYSFLFNLQNTEKFLIKNITLVSLLSIIIILYFQKDLWIKENDKILLMIWAIFAFWYWYKKYEGDKELKIIEKYTSLYDIIKRENNHKKLIDLWYKELFLFKSWYISNNLWNDWIYWIESDIFLYFKKDISKWIYYLLKENKIKVLNEKNFENISNKISELIIHNRWYFIHDLITLCVTWLYFWNFILERFKIVKEFNNTTLTNLELLKSVTNENERSTIIEWIDLNYYFWLPELYSKILDKIIKQIEEINVKSKKFKL